MQTQPLMQSPDRGPSVRHDLGGGNDVQLPSLITNQATIMGVFQAPTRLARRLLPLKQLRLVEVKPGTTLLGVACMEYRNVQGLDPYNECGIMLPVRYKPRFDVPLLPLLAQKQFRAGNYFHCMPLNSPQAYDIGIRMHGLRKILADIEFVETDRTRTCNVTVDGQSLLSLEVKKTKKLRHSEMTTHTYTTIGSEVLRTPVPTRGKMGSMMGEGATLTLGSHAVADEIRELDISSKPTLAMYAPNIDSILAAPDRRY